MFNILKSTFRILFHPFPSCYSKHVVLLSQTRPYRSVRSCYSTIAFCTVGTRGKMLLLPNLPAVWLRGTGRQFPAAAQRVHFRTTDEICRSLRSSITVRSIKPRCVAVSVNGFNFLSKKDDWLWTDIIYWTDDISGNLAVLSFLLLMALSSKKFMSLNGVLVSRETNSPCALSLAFLTHIVLSTLSLYTGFSSWSCWEVPLGRCSPRRRSILCCCWAPWPVPASHTGPCTASSWPPPASPSCSAPRRRCSPPWKCWTDYNRFLGWHNLLFNLETLSNNMIFVTFLLRLISFWSMEMFLSPALASSFFSRVIWNEVK